MATLVCRHRHHRPEPHERLMGARIARARKAVATALGFAVALVLLVPQETIPEQWRPWVGLLLAAGTVAGVYRVRNDGPPTVAPTLFAGRRVKDTNLPRE
jgi:hypothetical protein